MLIRLRGLEMRPRRQFQYCTMWAEVEEFQSIVAAAWQEQFQGTKMYVVMRKMQALQKALLALNKSKFHNI